MSARDKPNPGSIEARALGCTCPMWDNLLGAGVKGSDGAVQFWTSADCPLHGSSAMPRDPATIDLFGAC